MHGLVRHRSPRALQGCTTDPRHKVDPSLNLVKNHPVPSTTPTVISFAAIQQLQDYVDRTLRFPTGFGTSLTPQQRRALTRIPTTLGALGEGTVVALTGYITSTVSPRNPNPHYA